MIKIINVTINFSDKCNCGSWLKHWENFNSKPVVFCSEIRCTQMFHLAGCHVQKVGNDKETYIIPLCKEHSKVTNELYAVKSTKFVSSNKNKTCNLVDLS